MTAVPETVFRLRVCFVKHGRLRFLSHLEVVRACERAVRRAGLPYAVTHGFNPHMRISFGPALPVGTAGEHEYFDVWLLAHVSAAEARDRLSATIAADLAPAEARYVNDKEPSLSAVLTLAVYDVAVEGGSDLEGSLKSSLASVVADGSLAVEHKGKTKVFEFASTLLKEPDVHSSAGRVVITVSVRIGERGSLRPEAFVNAALARSASAGRILS
ncbi:MAG TPA: TIGR03936 family radical SAM-associated protein, partial [Coriobacteriia bacterium]|nr:TIGR03936 family radical SAM-associated protein [Coriobacteriia bacterium]